MKLIGGEIDHHPDGIYRYLTDSGRSSIRLILESGLAKKRFLLPDYLCKIIPGVFDELNVRYSYYHVNSDLTIDYDSIGGTQFDVLYLIDYFGSRHKITHVLDRKEIWFVEDSVFLPAVDPPAGILNWIGFNSLRKISYLADGSIVKSTMELCRELIDRSDPPFSSMKYEAKSMKFDFIKRNEFTEEEYLRLFVDAENEIDAQKNIFSISNRSMGNLLDFYRVLDEERANRTRNYQILDKMLGRFKINIDVDFPVLFPMSVEYRDELREYLSSHRIYLPVHWPKISGLQNELYDRIISIPVDSRYGESDMIRVAGLVNDFYIDRRI